MASIFKRPRSPFWWVKYRDPASGKICRESTLQSCNGPGTRRAREIEAEKTLLERRASQSVDRGSFDTWVKPYLNTKYRYNEKTLDRYLTCWRTLELFLAETKIKFPIQLRREHCFDYLAWREQPKVRNGKYRAGHNTALLELKILAMIMKEAVIRDYANANPARDLDIKRAPRKIKPELLDQDYQLILDHVATEPEPHRTAFRNSLLVARYHGARLNETNVNPCRDVKLTTTAAGTKGEITFKQKGGKVRVKPLHPELVPLFAELQQQKAKHTYEPWAWGNRWTKLLRRIGLAERKPNVCFHSTRVTVETRLARAGVDKAIRMEYLSHDSQDVNDSYNRFTPDDLRVCHAVAL